MADDDFEARLKAELPRGLTPQKSLGRERALSARWLGAEEMTGETWEYGRKGLLLGRRKGGLIGWDDNRHVLTVAGSRAGKGVSLIVPNLILYEGSAFVIDPKGENAAITAGRRGKGTRKKGAGLGQDVYVLDPFDVSGKRSGGNVPSLSIPWLSSISTARTWSRTPRCSPRRSSRILKRTATGRSRRKPCCAR